jgi:hypothetical protein
MRKSLFRSALGALAVLVALFATLGEAETSGGGSSAGGGNDGSAKEGSAETTQPTSSQASPIPIGTDVEVAKGWNLKVNSAELNANATVAATNQFTTPDPGKQFVIVNVTITNNSGEPGEPLFEMKVSALPPSGIGVDRAFVSGLPDEINTSAQMQPGASMTGALVFEIPSAEVPGTVLLGQSQFTLSENEDQKFFAIQ